MLNQKITNQLRTPPGRDSSALEPRVIDSFDWRSYYSGSDVRFEFDGIPIDEICGLSYRVTELVVPHYGYASYTRLGVSRGVRSVQGSILFNFRDPAQLRYLLRVIANNEGPDVASPSLIRRDSITQDSKAIAERVKRGDISVDEAKRLLKAGSDPGQPGSGKPSKEMMEAFRASIWSKNSPVKLAEKDPYSEENRRRAPLYKSRYNGFNLRMIFGEPGSTNTVYQQIPSADETRRQTGAVRVLRGVEIASEAQEISETGEPTRLMLEFSAADID